MVGYIIIGIAVVIGFIIFTYHNALLDVAKDSAACSIQGPECPHLKDSNQQLMINMIILGIMILIGLYMVFFSQEERIITRIKKVKEQIEPKHISKQNYEKIMDELSSEEKDVLEKVIDAHGSAFQSDLVKKTELSKVAITRILDRLEGKGLIERRRRGMTNVVILKH